MDLSFELSEIQMKEIKSFCLDYQNSYLIIAIDEYNDVFIIERKGQLTALFKEPVDLLPNDDCRYLLWRNNCNKNNDLPEILLFFWNPPICDSERLLLYSSNLEYIKGFISNLSDTLSFRSKSEFSKFL